MQSWVLPSPWAGLDEMKKKKAKATQQNSYASAELCSLQTLPGAQGRTAGRCSKREPAAVNPEGFGYSVPVLTPLLQLLTVFLGADFSLDCLNFCQTPRCCFAGLVHVFCVSILGFAGRDTWCFYP